ncbi:integrase [Pedobacter cryoconitis]|uniref:site-specific integrase n=1 Tax=Pedobacter cryoconitis TaxID=188932 RepID=UPI0016139565|nr:site-specific integrase [Pedobacter cryoconitis]MBB6273136.1 integrase [Pedobacter cryoconitis]
MSVHIRRAKPTKKGRVRMSLELNYNGKTWFEPLNVFEYENPKTPEEREHNKSKKIYAEKTRVLKISEFENEGGSSPVNYRGQQSFITYFKKLANEKYEVEGNYATWQATYQHLLNFVDGQDTKFKDCNDDFLNRFRTYLLKTKSRKSDTDLSINSANVYLSKVKAALNRAQVERIVTDNPSSRIKNITREETEREFLSHDELVRLKGTHCDYTLLKKAFIFSCLTGLRWSDVAKLKWKEVIFTKQDDKWKIHYTQKKTKKKQYHPIKKQAVELLGEFGEADEVVFKGLHYSANNNRILIKWVKAAEINKHITFHCARHTYAVISLIATKNLFLVSDLLGHSDIKTTQIYAKIVNETKDIGVDLFPDI